MTSELPHEGIAPEKFGSTALGKVAATVIIEAKGYSLPTTADDQK